MEIKQQEILSIMESVGVSVDVAKIKSDMTFKNAGIDSLEMMNVFLGIEEKFGIKIPDEEIDALKSIDDIISYFKKL
jgi:acyl carrier protein